MTLAHIARRTRKSRKNYRPPTDQWILKKARAIAEKACRRYSKPFVNPAVVADYLIPLFAGLEHEVFGVIFLDRRHRTIAFEKLFRGTIDGAAVHPREIVKAALQYNAAAVILAHNHPSGEASPSAADIEITKRVQAALQLVDVNVVDHLIIAGGRHLSMNDCGHIQ